MGGNTSKSDQQRIIEKVENSELVNTSTSDDLEENKHNFMKIPGNHTKKDDRFKEFRRLLEKIRKEPKYVDKCALLTDMLTFGSDAPKHIFEAIHPDAYSTFLSCNDIVLSLNKCFPKLLTQVVTKPKSNLDKLNNLNNSDQFPVNINIKGFEKPHASKHREETKSNKTEKADTTKIPRIILRNDNTFEEFREFIVNIQKEKYLADKSALLTEIFKFGSHNVENVIMWCMLLLPEQNHMIKYMNIDQLVKLFSRIFVEDASEIYNHLEKSNGINESIAHFYNEKMDPPSSTTLTIEQVNEFFYLLSQLDKKDEQVNHIKKFLPSCTVEDVNCIVKLMRHNLKIDLAPKYILEAIYPEAYSSFLSFGSISLALKHCFSKSTEILTQNIVVMKPFKPMVAVACKSIEQAINKFPNEINNPIDLAQYIKEIMKVRLEGLILKDINGKYEPGHKNWLKVTKMNLYGGSMANSANLIVLGGWCHDNKMSCLSSFLMGVYDAKTDKYYT
ncbi:PREDICTED: DNA ligase 3-like, partial [Nicrophorus vespilloides]|uniref:DNA ligase 3-like n=1 Tax=Nicrophorus vespilloides TaxID=110193 RepID=A0ABM1MUG5_NICVS